MATFLVSYDLRGRDETSADYKPLIEHLKTYGTWARPLKSVWVIETTARAAEVRDAITEHLDSNDGLIVVKVGAPGAWRGLSSNVSDWLKKHLN